MEDEFARLRFRMYHNKEIPSLIGLSKWAFAREIRPHRLRLGPRIGYHWRFEQVTAILKIFGVPYVIVS